MQNCRTWRVRYRLLVLALIGLPSLAWAAEPDAAGPAESRATGASAPNLTIAPNNETPIDPAQALDARLNYVSLQAARAFGDYRIRQPGVRVRLGAGIEVKTDDQRLIAIEPLVSALRVLDAGGNEVFAHPFPKQVKVHRLRIPLVARRSMDRADAGEAGFGGVFSTEAELGPTLRKVTLGAAMVVAERLETIDLSLPAENFSRKPGEKPKGETFQPLELWDGTTLTLNRITVRGFRATLEFALRTRDPEAFEPFVHVKVEEATPIVLYGPLIVRGDKPTSRAILRLSGLEQPDNDDEPATGRASLEAQLLRKDERPTKLRFYVARNVRAVPVIATVEDLPLGAVLNVGED